MPGQIILSNRHRALLDSMANFGESIAGIRKAQKDDAEQKLRMRREATAADAGDAQLADFKGQQAAKTQAADLSQQLDSFGTAVPDSAISLPGMVTQQSPRPAMDPTADSLKDRLRASMHNAGLQAEGKSVGFVTADDIRKQRAAGMLAASQDQEKFTSDQAKTKAETAKLNADAGKEDANWDKMETTDGIYLYNKKTGDIKPAGKDGKPLMGKDAAAGKAPNKEQFDAAGFGRRMELANNAFEGLVRSGYDRSSTKGSVQAALPNAAPGKGSAAQQWDQAERNFVNATLRRESGAAISPQEFANAEKQYFPRFGDSEETKKQKATNRAQVMENMRASAGNAWDQVKLVSPAGSKPKEDPLGLF